MELIPKIDFSFILNWLRTKPKPKKPVYRVNDALIELDVTNFRSMIDQRIQNHYLVEVKADEDDTWVRIGIFTDWIRVLHAIEKHKEGYLGEEIIIEDVAEFKGQTQQKPTN